MLLFVSALWTGLAQAADDPAERGLIAGVVALGTEVGGTLGGAAIGTGVSIVYLSSPAAQNANNPYAAVIPAALGVTLGLAAGTMGSGAVAGLATGRSPLAMTGVTTAVSLGGLALTIGVAGSGGDGAAVVGVGTLLAVPVAAGIAAAVMPEHHARRTSVSLTPTFGKHGGGVRLAGDF